MLYYGVAFVAYLYGLSRVPASVAGAFVNLTPVVVLAASVLFLREAVRLPQLVGTLLVVAAVYGLAVTDDGRQT